MNTRKTIVVAAFLALTATRTFAVETTQPPMGTPDEMNEMGVRYATGNGVPKDYVAALAAHTLVVERVPMQ